MTTIATTALPITYNWNISIGSGWIVLMLIGMALCVVCMVAFMSLMRDGRAWPFCGAGWHPTTTRQESERSSR